MNEFIICIYLLYQLNNGKDCLNFGTVEQKIIISKIMKNEQ
jgi:hypothetical protein